MMNLRLAKLFADIFTLPLWRACNLFIPKRNQYWGFPVHHIKSDQFIESPRAIFEEIKSDERIKKIIFARSDRNDFGITNAKNTVIVNINSWNGLWMLAKCRVLFVTNSISMEYSLRWGGKLFSVVKVSLKKCVVVHISHGISVKKINAVANTIVRRRLGRVSFRAKEPFYYSGLLASSDMDSYVMAATYYPVKYKNVWITGLPRNDWLVQPLDALPSYFSAHVEIIRKIKKGKRLITYAPTYRQTAALKESAYYQFSKEEIEELKQLLKRHNAVFGFRMHYFRNSNNLFNIEQFIDNEYIFNIGHDKISDIAPIIRESDCIVTDYSSVYVDALYINKPVFCFGYDLESYRQSQDGLLFDFDLTFPGPVVSTFKQLIEEFEKELTKESQGSSDKYKVARKMFFRYSDDKNTRRVIERVEEALTTR